MITMSDLFQIQISKIVEMNHKEKTYCATGIVLRNKKKKTR
jgi:hypothetical protein